MGEERKWFARDLPQDSEASDLTSYNLRPIKPHEPFSSTDRYVVVGDDERATYEPLTEEPGLFLRYAGIGRELYRAYPADWSPGNEYEQALLSFVSAYGLPKGEEMASPSVDGSERDLFEPRRYPALELIGDTRDMCQAVYTLRAAKAWRSYRTNMFGEIPFINESPLIGIPPDEAASRAWGGLAELLNRNLHNVHLITAPTETGLIRGLVPTSLSAAMWLQLYQAVSDEEPFRHCGNENCSQLVSTSDPRRRYCSNNCRNAANQRRWYQRKRHGSEATKKRSGK